MDKTFDKTSDKIIIGENIVKTFGTGSEKTNALNGVNTDLFKGEFVAVMGPSGSGKSTLLFALSGMDNITGGSVKVNDIEISELNENKLADLRRVKMGFVFQQPTMLKNLNILDNIILPAVQNGKKNITGITQKAMALMEKTGIKALEKREITEVSGGQLQRAGICRALINSPEILFADEPTGSLNSKTTEEIMALLVDINKEGTAVLLVTHDAKVASRADRVLFTKDGAIVFNLLLGKYKETDLQQRSENIVVQMSSIGI